MLFTAKVKLNEAKFQVVKFFSDKIMCTAEFLARLAVKFVERSTGLKVQHEPIEDQLVKAWEQGYLDGMKRQREVDDHMSMP